MLRHGARQPSPALAALSQGRTRNLHTPDRRPASSVAILAAIPLFKYAGAGYVAIAATGMIYLAYFLGNLAVLGGTTEGMAEGEDAVLARANGDRSSTSWPSS